MGIKDYFGNITTLLVDIPNAELKSEIQAALLDAQGEGLDLQERNARLQEENSELKKSLENRDKAERLEREVLYLAIGVLWRRDEELFQAYCPSCWAGDQLLIPLTRQYRNPLQYGGICPTCQAKFDHTYHGSKPEPSTK